MARPRGKSFTQQYHHHQQEEEVPPRSIAINTSPTHTNNTAPFFFILALFVFSQLPNLNVQVEYINSLLKWSIQDLDHLISVLRQRYEAAETS